VDVIYEHGILHPLAPLNLPESTEVALILQAKKDQENGTSSDPVIGLMADESKLMDEVVDKAMIARQRDALTSRRAQNDALPAGAPQDGLGGVDHDLILHGWQK
jgi:predicted DNA-binding antitoxin AbrB/MazE fold protein